MWSKWPLKGVTASSIPAGPFASLDLREAVGRVGSSDQKCCLALPLSPIFPPFSFGSLNLAWNSYFITFRNKTVLTDSQKVKNFSFVFRFPGVFILVHCRLYAFQSYSVSFNSYDCVTWSPLSQLLLVYVDWQEARAQALLSTLFWFVTRLPALCHRVEISGWNISCLYLMRMPCSCNSLAECILFESFRISDKIMKVASVSCHLVWPSWWLCPA